MTMPLTNEDMARLDDRYVKQDACDTKHRAVDERQNATEVKVAVTSSQLATLIKILAAIGAPTAAGVIAIAIKVIFGGT
jgi:hypothetical protein